MWNNTLAARLLNIKYPIVQGPFGGSFSSVRLTTTISNLGGLGSFGLNAFSPNEITDIGKEIKASTKLPFSLNLWVSLDPDPAHEFTVEQFEMLKAHFKPAFEELGVSLPTAPIEQKQNFEQKVEAVLALKPPVMSFIFGVPPKEVIAEMKKENIISIGTATTLDEALAIEEAGMDIVVASGLEAGGHRASFLKPAEQSLHPTFSLVQEIVTRAKSPIIAAGGISDQAAIVKALKLGASGVQMGTAFLATNESNASEIHKNRLLSTTLLKTELTKIYTGRLARALRNNFTERFGQIKEGITAPYPIQSSFLSTLRTAAIAQKQYDYVAFWAGEPSSVLTYRSAELLFKSLVQSLNQLDNHIDTNPSIIR